MTLDQTDCSALAEMGRAYGIVIGVAEALAYMSHDEVIKNDALARLEAADCIWCKAVGKLGQMTHTTYRDGGVSATPAVLREWRNPATGGMVATCESRSGGSE